MRLEKYVVVLGIVGFSVVSGDARADDAAVATSPPPSPPPTSNQTSGPPPDSSSCPVTPPADSSCSCSCRIRCCARSCHCDNTPKVSLSVSGIRGSLTHVQTPLQSTDAVGAAFAGAVDSYALDGTTHGAASFILGGGSSGFEGALAGTIDVGYRVPITDQTGPFGRAGFDGRLQGNDDYYFSTLELPRLTLGWQFLHEKIVVEAGAHGGPILTGRYNPGAEGYRRLSGSLEWGGFVSAQMDFLRVDLNAMRIEARKTGDGRPVDVGKGSVCGVAGKVGVCLDAMLMRGDADMGPNAGGVQTAMATYAGLTVGLASW